jgi:hypothetical protein
MSEKTLKAAITLNDMQSAEIKNLYRELNTAYEEIGKLKYQLSQCSRNHNDKTQHIISSLLFELRRAETIHPRWPKDIIHSVGIMCEESGEAIQAALDNVYAGKPLSAIKTEVIQTGAMAIRILKNMEGI